jgi:hypothetical protein
MKSAVHEFLSVLIELKIHHWSTMSFARHKATDQCFADFHTLVDKYMEALLGQVSRKQIFKQIDALHVDLKSACSASHMKNRILKLIRGLEQKKLPQDLANIRDDMITTLHTCLYLFSLH